MNKIIKIFLLLCIAMFMGCKSGSYVKNKKKDYPNAPVPFTSVQLSDGFWLPRIKINAEKTIPFAFKQSEETGRIDNFEVAGGLKPGTFCSKYPFDDSDVFKIIEGASYSLQQYPDSTLEAYLDSLIYKISKAQEDDGYLYTNRTIDPDNAHEWAGKNRWQFTHYLSHELYNVGHMYEAAVAHYYATGKRSFLDVAIKNADLVCEDFGWNKTESYPGHQEIEIGLVKLYRVTGNTKYLDQAKFFLDVRGPDSLEYNQSHKKVINQTEAVGHAVRACYMYSAMADVAALTGDKDYIDAIQTIWDDVIYKKYYITGGIGSSRENEGFDTAHHLPNKEAYCETCASIAHVFWNHRMFLLTGESKYIDVLERTLYNALLSGISLKGDRFFYPNPLESDGTHERKKWFGCACCPSNITRFLPSLPGYIYAVNDNNLYINLYIESSATIDINGDAVHIQQENNYPWDGQLNFIISPSKPAVYSIMLKIPGWATNKPAPGNLYTFVNANSADIEILVNDEKVINPDTSNGYFVLKRKWKKGDNINLFIPMDVNRIKSNEKVTVSTGKYAFQRGPLVYCFEDIDNSGTINNTLVPDSSHITSTFNEGLLNGVVTIQTDGYKVFEEESGRRMLSDRPIKLTAIPYYTWANREATPMKVWMPYDIRYVNPVFMMY